MKFHATTKFINKNLCCYQQTGFVRFYYEQSPGLIMAQENRLRDVKPLFADTPTLEAIDLSKLPMPYLEEACSHLTVEHEPKQGMKISLDYQYDLY